MRLTETTYVPEKAYSVMIYLWISTLRLSLSLICKIPFFIFSLSSCQKWESDRSSVLWIRCVSSRCFVSFLLHTISLPSLSLSEYDFPSVPPFLLSHPLTFSLLSRLHWFTRDNLIEYSFYPSRSINCVKLVSCVLFCSVPVSDSVFFLFLIQNWLCSSTFCVIKFNPFFSFKTINIPKFTLFCRIPYMIHQIGSIHFLYIY